MIQFAKNWLLPSILLMVFGLGCVGIGYSAGRLSMTWILEEVYHEIQLTRIQIYRVEEMKCQAPVISTQPKGGKT